MQISVRFVHNWHYSVKQRHTLLLIILFIASLLVTAIDPTRDIETLPEDIQIATMPRKPLVSFVQSKTQADNLSNADTEDEPQLGKFQIILC